MRPAVVLLILSLSLVPPTAAAAATDLDGLDGGKLTAAELKQGNVILVIWASWSPRCRDVVDRANALAAKWSPRARVATVVFREEPATVRDFLRGKQLRPPVYLDTSGAFSKKHGVATLPALLVIKDGTDGFAGKLPADPDPVIERALAAQ